MDKTVLKQTLHEQFVPLEKAVQNKLSYLQSDNVFNEDDLDEFVNDDTAEDDSLENAFNATLSVPVTPVYQPPAVEEVKQMQQAAQPAYVSGSAPTQSSISEHRQNMAARIAALRGISLPGDYLRNKK